MACAIVGETAAMNADADTVAELRSVTHRYGKTLALSNVSIDIASRRMIALIGPDGVGKSTLQALIAGVRRIQPGWVHSLGGAMGDLAPRAAVCSRFAYMPQGLGRNLYPTLSVYENIDFFGRLFGQALEERRWRINELLRSTAL